MIKRGVFLILFFITHLSVAVDGQMSLFWEEEESAGGPQAPFMSFEGNTVDGDDNKGNNPSDGTAVSIWFDQESKQNIEANVARRALYYGSVFNGHAALRFTNDAYEAGAISDLDNVKSYTVMIVCKPTVTATNYLYSIGTTSCDYTQLCYFNTSGWTIWGRNNSCANSNTPVPSPVNTEYLITTTWDNDKMDLQAKSLSANVSTSELTGRDREAGHSYIILGSFRPSFGHFDGDIGAFYIFTPALSAADETHWQDYLFEKYIE